MHPVKDEVDEVTSTSVDTPHVCEKRAIRSKGQHAGWQFMLPPARTHLAPYGPQMLLRMRFRPGRHSGEGVNSRPRPSLSLYPCSKLRIHADHRFALVGANNQATEH